MRDSILLLLPPSNVHLFPLFDDCLEADICLSSLIKDLIRDDFIVFWLTNWGESFVWSIVRNVDIDPLYMWHDLFWKIMIFQDKSFVRIFPAISHERRAAHSYYWRSIRKIYLCTINRLVIIAFFRLKGLLIKKLTSWGLAMIEKFRSCCLVKLFLVFTFNEISWLQIQLRYIMFDSASKSSVRLLKYLPINIKSWFWVSFKLIDWILRPHP